MGNCWPKPVESLPSAPKPASPAAETRDHQHKGSKTRGSISTVNVVSLDVDYNNNFPLDDHQRHVVLVKDSTEGGVDHHRYDHDHDQDGAASEAPTTAANTCSSTGPGGGQIMATPNLKMFTYSELRSATRNFRPDTVLGEGGFGRVFRGWVDEKTYAPSKVGVGIPVAVKKSNPDSEQGLSEWQAEVKLLGKFCHPNLVKLLGYCWEDKEFLLVYEYMQRGSLESHLFRKGAETLAWETRLKIATGAARGLAFLHTTEKQVIYRDFKASNILLDSEFNAKLSDFGLAKLGPVNGYSHVTTRVVGTYGYAAPEYMATGHLYVKSDVYGFGVVLLEIISGLRVLDLNRPSREQNLVDWAKPLLPEKRKLRKLMDPQLEGRYPSRGAFQIAHLILNCLEPDPKKRPSMEQVLETLQQIRTVQMKPKDAKAAAQQQQAAAAQQQRRLRPANHTRTHRTHNRSPLHTKQSSGCSSVIGAGTQHRDKLPGKYS